MFQFDIDEQNNVYSQHWFIYVKLSSYHKFSLL